MCATPQWSRCTRALCRNPRTLIVPRTTASAAFARASRLAASVCGEAARTIVKLKATTRMNFLIDKSLDRQDHSVKFLAKAPRAYTTPRQDARLCRPMRAAPNTFATETRRMRHSSIFFNSLFLYLLASFSVGAQLPPAKDSLRPAQSSQSSTACSATDTSSCAQAAAKIVPLVMGPSPMEENLRRLTDEIGGRVTGSSEMTKAIEWALAAFRAEGIEVHTEEYRLPVTWSEGGTHLELIGPVNFPVRLKAEGWSPATPLGGIEASLVDVNYGTEDDFSRAGSGIKGAVLLVHSDIGSTWADLFNEYLRPPEIIARAIQGGASAILWMGARERLLLYRHTNSLTGAIDKIPQAIVAREDAMRLARTVAAYPSKILVRFNMPNKIGGPIDQQNVVGEIRGYEKPDETVVLGAHLDSWELGTGALDNGCNAALVIEAARAIKASGLLPRRSIRFVLFSGEEQGTVGSYAYVKAHRVEMDKIRAMIAFDAGIGRVTG